MIPHGQNVRQPLKYPYQASRLVTLATPRPMSRESCFGAQGQKEEWSLVHYPLFPISRGLLALIPSFVFWNNTGAPYGDFDLLISPVHPTTHQVASSTQPTLAEPFDKGREPGVSLHPLARSYDQPRVSGDMVRSVLFCENTGLWTGWRRSLAYILCESDTNCCSINENKIVRPRSFLAKQKRVSLIPFSSLPLTSMVGTKTTKITTPFSLEQSPSYQIDPKTNSCEHLPFEKHALEVWAHISKRSLHTIPTYPWASLEVPHKEGLLQVP